MVLRHGRIDRVFKRAYSKNEVLLLEPHTMKSPHSQLRVQQNPLQATELIAIESNVAIELHFSMPLPAEQTPPNETNSSPAYLERRRKRRRRRHHSVGASGRPFWSLFSVQV